jgi:hypothetical protein
VLVRIGEDAVQTGFTPMALIASPITGADGNREFLALLGPGTGSGPPWVSLVDGLVPSAV